MADQPADVRVGEDVLDQTHAAGPVQPGAVAHHDARRLLAAVLQGDEAVVRHSGRIVRWTMQRDEAAVLSDAFADHGRTRRATAITPAPVVTWLRAAVGDFPGSALPRRVIRRRGITRPAGRGRSRCP